MPAADYRILTDATGQRIATALEGVENNMIDKLQKDFSTLSALPADPATGDLLPIASGGTTYKIDYNALAAAILNRLGAGSDGVVDITHGGTNATTAEQAVANLGIGAIINGTTLTPPIPNGGASTVVSTMTLNRGKYIVMASGWSPLGGPSTAQSTSFFIGGWGSTSLTWSFNLAVIVVVDSDNTVIEGRVMNWEPDSFAQAGTDYIMRAIKIA